MAGTLVLNATFQPLNVVTVPRALTLIHSGKAVLEHSDATRMLRSPTAEFPLPLVIRLLRNVRVPYRAVPFSRRAVLVRDDFRCQYDDCLRPGRTVDHVVPISRDGSARDYRNVVAACSWHNNRKAARTPGESGFRLRRRPRQPSVGDMVLAGVDPRVKEWLADIGL